MSLGCKARMVVINITYPSHVFLHDGGTMYSSDSKVDIASNPCTNSYPASTNVCMRDNLICILAKSFNLT